ncbi:hypothetical protein OBK19_13350, partial [Empedobacter falsenii]
KRYFNQVFLFSIIVYAISGIKDEQLLSNRMTLEFLLYFYVSSFVIRIIIITFYKYLLKNGYYVSNVCIIGINNNTEIFVETLNSTLGNNFRGLISKIKNPNFLRWIL